MTHHTYRTNWAACFAVGCAALATGVAVGVFFTSTAPPIKCCEKYNDEELVADIRNLKLRVKFIEEREGQLGHWQCGSEGCWWIADQVPPDLSERVEQMELTASIALANIVRLGKRIDDLPVCKCQATKLMPEVIPAPPPTKPIPTCPPLKAKP